jgi:hypothetical protein
LRAITQNLIANVLWIILVFAALFILWFNISGNSEKVKKSLQNNVKLYLEKDTNVVEN